MENKHILLSKVCATLLMIGVTGLSQTAFAEKTLDAMNSLTPAAPSQLSSSKPIIIPAAPQVDAKAYVLMDANSQSIIAANNPDEHLPPASLTKLMTLYVAFNALKSGQIKLDDQVTVSSKAWKTGGSRMFIQVNTQVSVKDLLQGIVIASGNDAAVALAEYIGGSEDSFTDLMNQEAQRLGLTDSHFTDCNGLPHPDHYTSARDMALLASHIINDFPEYYSMFSEKYFTYNNIKQNNRNRLLWRYEDADGLKTGHTDDAGYCLVASAKKDDMRLISVVLGAPSDSMRATDSISLLTYGFRFYKTYKLYSANDSITKARVWKGENKTVAAGSNKDIYVTLPIGQYDKLAANASLNNPINAPVTKGEQIGTLNISLEDKPLMQQPLVALQDDPKSGIWGQIADSITSSIQKLFKKKAPAALAEQVGTQAS